MITLFPIVRRVRRSLLPPDDVVVTAVPKTEEVPAVPPSVAETESMTAAVAEAPNLPAEQTDVNTTVELPRDYVPSTPEPQPLTKRAKSKSVSKTA